MADKEFKGINSRQYYRVTYPEKERPWIKIDGDLLQVMDISEKGGKFLNAVGIKVDPGSRITGTITFHDGETITVTGDVLREFYDQIIICFTKGIPFSTMIKEQRYLREKYKHLF